MNRKVIAGYVSFGVALCVLLCTWAGAQENNADTMPFVIEKIMADKKLFVAENLQLTQAESEKFWPVYKQYQDELFLLRSRTVKLINDYVQSYDAMTDEVAKTLLDEFLEIERLGFELRKVFLPRFRSVVPDVKVAKYFQIENKINAALMYEIAAQIPLIKTD